MDAKTGCLTALTLAHGMLEGMIKDFPESKLTFQPCPTDNHLAWVLGHYPLGYGYFAQLFGGQITGIPENFNALFGQGSKPVDEPARYPSLATLKAVFDSSYRQFRSLVESTPIEELYKPTAIPSSFVATKLDAVHAVIWHDGWHGGQLASLRKALGLPNVMG